MLVINAQFGKNSSKKKKVGHLLVLNNYGLWEHHILTKIIYVLEVVVLFFSELFFPNWVDYNMYRLEISSKACLHII